MVAWHRVSGGSVNIDTTVEGSDMHTGRKPLYADNLGYLALAWMRKKHLLQGRNRVVGVRYTWSDIVVPDGFVTLEVNNAVRMLTVAQAAKLRMTGGI
jgi:hypothetical protein